MQTLKDSLKAILKAWNRRTMMTITKKVNQPFLITKSQLLQLLRTGKARINLPYPEIEFNIQEVDDNDSQITGE